MHRIIFAVAAAVCLGAGTYFAAYAHGYANACEAHGISLIDR